MTLSVAFQHSLGGFSLDIEFEAPTPGIIALFGPSGCGKSTVVNAVAGLLRPNRAHIEIDDHVLADSELGVLIPPERRGIGLVFQDTRLFPHMSVAANLRYGQRRAPPGPISFDDVVSLLGIGVLLRRRPAHLSGGERQRVAIGRALLAQPRLLAMDEPLASLDAPRRAEILPYLARLKTALALPILYVTHALDEVARLADTLVLLEEGRVLAAGPVEQILTRGDLPMAARDDAAAVLPARIEHHDRERRLTRLMTGGRTLWVPLLDRAEGSALRVRIPAREVILALEEPRGISLHNIVPGTVGAIVPDPERAASLVEVSLDGVGLLARITPDAVTHLNLRRGSPVLALIKSVAIEAL
jgi:molybdate transport system ATP-binding protein